MRFFKKGFGFGAVLCGFFLTVNTAWATLITNGSFETGPSLGSFITLGTGDTSITGWTVADGNIDYIGSFWSSSDGSRSLDLNGSEPGAISQAFATVIGTTYEVQFDLAGNPDLPIIKTLRVAAAGDSEDFTFDITHQSLSNMGWAAKSWSFTAIGPTTTLEFISLTSNYAGPALDNVRVDALNTTPTPEPSTMLLLSTGLVSFVGYGWRRQSRKRRLTSDPA